MTDPTTAPEWDRPDVLAVVDKDGDLWAPRTRGRWSCAPNGETLSAGDIERLYGPCFPLVRECITQRQHAEHLSRATDAAYAQGFREGRAASAAGRADGRASHAAEVPALHRWCDHGIGYWPCGLADLVALTTQDPQPRTETTPQDAEPPADEVNRFSADAAVCGFACCCQRPPVAGWAPGSVTR